MKSAVIKRLLTPWMLLALAALAASCGTRGSSGSATKEIYGGFNYPEEVWICNHEPRGLYLALNGAYDFVAFSRGWLYVPQGTSAGPGCIEAFRYFYTFPEGTDPLSPDAKTDRYGVNTVGASAFVGTGNDSNYIPTDYSTYAEYVDAAGRMCVPNTREATAQNDWVLEYSWTLQTCPEGSRFRPAMRLDFVWDSSISKPFGSQEMGNEGDGERYRADIRSGVFDYTPEIDQYGYRGDSPVPVDVRETIHRDIIPNALVDGREIDAALKTWEGTLTPEQTNILLTVRAIGAAFRSAANETATLVEKAKGWVTGAAKAVREGVSCATKTVVLGDYGDLYEILGGRDLCTGEELTLSGRALTAAGLIGGSGMFWRAVGSVIGIPVAAKKVTALAVDAIEQRTLFEVTAKELRKLPGVAQISSPLADHARLLRGKLGNAGLVPKEIGEKLAGRSFNDFDALRNAFWKEVAESRYAREFDAESLAFMRQGRAPFADLEQSLGQRRRYELHHIAPINQGGSVYDLSNLAVVTPRFHAEILDRAYHYGTDGL